MNLFLSLDPSCGLLGVLNVSLITSDKSDAVEAIEATIILADLQKTTKFLKRN